MEKFMANKMSEVSFLYNLFIFVQPCIGKLWLVVEAPVDYISNGLRTK